eukprot:3646792-Alexandrium_andersonii.AAC.1
MAVLLSCLHGHPQARDQGAVLRRMHGRAEDRQMMHTAGLRGASDVIRIGPQTSHPATNI